MMDAQNKENVAPTSSGLLQRRDSSPGKKGHMKGRSKSIGAGDSVDSVLDAAKEKAKTRRKSAFTPASKSIMASEAEKKERQAARRKTLANRRVSFAPEATLHTWDIVDYMRDQTSSTDSPNVTRSAGRGPLFPSSPTAASSDAEEPPSTPPEQEDGLKKLPASPAPQRHLHRKQRRRSSGMSNASDDVDLSGMSDSGQVSGSDSEGEGEGEDDDAEVEEVTGTAMSMDMDEETARSLSSASSTGSSLTQRLRQAAETAGTRGIEYDEYGDQSMEMAGEEVTNAFKPWAQRATVETVGSASLDQENINPFSPAFKAQIAPGIVSRPSTIAEEETGDMSMELTRAVGGIQAQRKAEAALAESSPLGNQTMEFTQAIGKIQKQPSPIARPGLKRRRSMATTEAGSPGVEPAQSKRNRRSSIARSSMGDDTMDLTVAMGGGIRTADSPTKPLERRKSVVRRRSSGVASEPEGATMDFTQAVGGIKTTAARRRSSGLGSEQDATMDFTQVACGIKPAVNTRSDHTSTSLDSNEELTMELTTVLGGIKTAAKPAAAATSPAQSSLSAIPSTPQKPQSPLRQAVNTTPKDQERFRDAPDSGPRKLLTPMFQKQARHSTEKAGSTGGLSGEKKKRRKTISPAPVSWTGPVFDESLIPKTDVKARFQPILERVNSEAEAPVVEYPSSSDPETEKSVTPQNAQEMLDAQPQEEAQRSPLVRRGPRSLPAKTVTPPAPKSPWPRNTTPTRLATPQVEEPSQEPRSTFADSIRLMSTPRKEALRNVTPRTGAQKPVSPVTAITPRLRPTSKGRGQLKTSPARQLSHELLNLLPEQQQQQPVPKVHLNDFLEEAGIRFMDLTATKRRLTIAPTPSRAHMTRASTGAADAEAEPEITLEAAIVSAACTRPEHDMFQHACHELKHYIAEGKKVIKQLVVETYNDTPPLIQAYMQASAEGLVERKAEIDAAMRDMKTQARLRSKEMWYAWRSQLLEDLMKGLSGIGEGLLKDDEVLTHAEGILEQVLPALEARYVALQQEAEMLEQAAAETNEEKEELEAARARLTAVDDEVEEKWKLLEELQRQAQEQEQLASDLQEQKAESTAATQEADRVREACRGVSLNEINTLKESIKHLEESYGWSITSASSSPPTVTMTYKSQLQLFFHPTTFQVPTQSAKSRQPNAPISLSYIAHDRDQRPKELATTPRFFLQLLRASLQGLPQCTTRVPDLLSLVSGGWDTALAVVEAERRLSLESPTTSRIVSDERIAIGSTILLPNVRTKIRVSHELLAAVGEGLQLSTTLETRVEVVYGEQYNEMKMTKFVSDRVTATDGWNNAVRDLRERLVAQGMKGFRK